MCFLQQTSGSWSTLPPNHWRRLATPMVAVLIQTTISGWPLGTPAKFSTSILRQVGVKFAVQTHMTISGLRILGSARWPTSIPSLVAMKVCKRQFLGGVFPSQNAVNFDTKICRNESCCIDINDKLWMTCIMANSVVHVDIKIGRIENCCLDSDDILWVAWFGVSK